MPSEAFDRMYAAARRADAEVIDLASRLTGPTTGRIEAVRLARRLVADGLPFFRFVAARASPRALARDAIADFAIVIAIAKPGPPEAAP